MIKWLAVRKKKPRFNAAMVRTRFPQPGWSSAAPPAASARNPLQVRCGRWSRIQRATRFHPAHAQARPRRVHPIRRRAVPKTLHARAVSAAPARHPNHGDETLSPSFSSSHLRTCANSAWSTVSTKAGLSCSDSGGNRSPANTSSARARSAPKTASASVHTVPAAAGSSRLRRSLRRCYAWCKELAEGQPAATRGKRKEKRPARIDACLGGFILVNVIQDGYTSVLLQTL